MSLRFVRHGHLLPLAFVLLHACTFGDPGYPEDNAMVCSDGVDNDRDLRTDCADADCALFCGGICGDGMCDLVYGESCMICDLDCGPCAVCGDGLCDMAGGEACDTCEPDCGSCTGPCGDGTCEATIGEDCGTCPKDCGDCCGDGVCNQAIENCAFCPEDCGMCTATCGNMMCDWSDEGETCGTCGSDCTCGAGTCADFNTCASACATSVCQTACWEATCLAGQTQYAAIVACQNTLCAVECDPVSGDQVACTNCTNASCVSQISACFSGGC